MTTYDEYSEFKISFWAGGQELLLPIKEDELVQTILQVAHPSTGMASELASETLFDDVSTCHTTKHLHSTIHKHQHPPSNSKHPHRYFNPAEYHITEIAVLKQRFFIQHEGLIIRVHHQPSESASASDSTQPAAAHSEPDFLISIDRNIDSTGLKSFFFSKKFAIDRVNCHLSPAASPAITGTFGRPVVWRIPSPNSNCTFNLNLS